MCTGKTRNIYTKTFENVGRISRRKKQEVEKQETIFLYGFLG